MADYFNPIDVVTVLASSEDPRYPYKISLRSGAAFRVSEETGQETLNAIANQQSQIERVVNALSALSDAIRYSG